MTSLAGCTLAGRVFVCAPNSCGVEPTPSMQIVTMHAVEYTKDKRLPTHCARCRHCCMNHNDAAGNAEGWLPRIHILEPLMEGIRHCIASGRASWKAYSIPVKIPPSERNPQPSLLNKRKSWKILGWLGKPHSSLSRSAMTTLGSVSRLPIRQCVHDDNPCNLQSLVQV